MAKPNGARAAAFGSGPRPFLGYDIGLRPLPSAAAFGQFVTRSLSEGNNKPRRSHLPALLINSYFLSNRRTFIVVHNRIINIFVIFIRFQNFHVCKPALSRGGRIQIKFPQQDSKFNQTTLRNEYSTMKIKADTRIMNKSVLNSKMPKFCRDLTKGHK